MKKQFLEEKILPKMMSFASWDPIIAIKNGFVSTMAITIVGSIFLLIASFPIISIQDWLNKIGLRVILLQAFNATFNILALVAALSIAYYYAKNKKVDALPCAILSLVSYVLLIDFIKIAPESKEVIKGVIPLTYLGARGMIVSIIIGLFTGKIYTWFILHNIKIKMPDTVPEGVANSFAAVIPGAFIITTMTIIYGIFSSLDTNFIDFIYNIIQTPLQGMTSSLGGVILIAFFMSFLWWFGIHGASIVGGIMAGILTANMNENQAIIEAGKVLNSTTGHIVTFNFRTLILIITGSGITIGIVLYFLFFAKSEQFKSLGKLAVIPAIFNINEPILFGTPIVFNTLLFIPFIGVPIVSGVVSYFAMDLGIVPLMGAINPPWTTPPIISGFLAGGYRLAILQLVIILISFFGYFPFIRRQDMIAYEEEQKVKE
ncbi:PTS sugar transporter subunit IIC [Oceanivirga salmonicida]|uniref:PTS sugar transporter subunit IIC n=1 Tax=Oceanivirga salmonicida TaxID=1769291 RepID=UPI00082C0C44|nr:PTS sugar transporter subunit IIC [Oceanivirga salmonicida]